jgi:glycolate oxidase iron-sulfur subunit
METNFTLQQLMDPDLKAADAVLQQCVHCGFCNATCPTYQLSQDEGDGPRGRIWIMRAFLTEGRQPSAEEKTYLDRCLTCLSCTTTCPAGVGYLHLADIARRKIERPWQERALRRLLTEILPKPGRLRISLTLSALARPFTKLMPSQLARMVEMTERGSKSKPLANGTYPAQGTQHMRVLMLTGCAQQSLDAEINHATVRLLTRLGVEVIVPANAGCCGALAEHLGHHHDAQESIRMMIKAWKNYSAVDAVVVNASGCGFHIKDWPFVMQDDPAYAEDAKRYADLSRDVSQIVAQLGIGSAPHVKGLGVALHLPCSLQHGQKITAEPKTLLEAAGFSVSLPVDSHLCCGAAGTYALTQPEVSDQLRKNKAAVLKATGATVIASSNMGCMNHIRPEASQPVVHLVQLLDWATGGPKPKGI